MRRAGLAVIAMSFALLAPSGTTAAQTIVRPLPHLVHHGMGTAQSTNWSGYAAYNTTFSVVKGSWIQPTARCPNAVPTYSSFWVGLDGYKSSSVEQIGTDADCQGTNSPNHYAWWEMYPNPSNPIAGFAVKPGDSITAQVSHLATVYTLTIRNNTTGQSYTTTQIAAAANSSAEWVAEAPSGCILIICTVLPLTNFGTVTFTGSSATSGTAKTISGYTNDSITMTNQIGQVRAVPSGLNPDGSGFSVVWKRS